jgi:hypothetical protein
MLYKCRHGENVQSTIAANKRQANCQSLAYQIQQFDERAAGCSVYNLDAVKRLKFIAAIIIRAVQNIHIPPSSSPSSVAVKSLSSATIYHRLTTYQLDHIARGQVACPLTPIAARVAPTRAWPVELLPVTAIL